MDANNVISHLKNLADKETAAHSQRYFKTGEGEYGHGDVFLGIRVPVVRKTVKQFPALTLTEIRKLLKSNYHEVRLFALLLLGHQFSRGDVATQARIYNLYLKQTRYINNWDLVDTTAPHIVGAWLLDNDRAVLYTLAKSKQLWERRIAIMATYWFIKHDQFNDTFKIASILINDPEDLIHKAVGWMLREVGNRNQRKEEDFLKKHYKQMPRTMLRYAIEKFSQTRRQAWLRGRV